MLKHAKKITIICYLIVFVVIAGFVVFFITGNLFGYDTGFRWNIGDGSFSFGNFIEIGTGDYAKQGEYSIPAGDIETVEVNWVSGIVDITAYDGNEILVTEYARRELKDSEKLAYKISGGELVIKYTQSDFTLFGNLPQKSVSIQIPKDMNAYIATPGGSDEKAIGAEARMLKLLKIAAVSADIDIGGITSDTVYASTTSGNASLNAVTANTLRFETVSGDAFSENVKASKAYWATTSGNFTFSGNINSLEAESVSGDVFVDSAETPASVSVDTVSGDASLNIPETDSISVSHDSVSGDFYSEIPTLSVKSGAAYSFDSVSGDVRIELKR